MNRWNAFRQLVLSRFREFFREPHAIFWVYGFPLILAIVLGFAFASAKPTPPSVDVVGSASDPAVEALVKPLQEAKIDVEVHDYAASHKRYVQGTISLMVVPRNPGEGPKYQYDQARSESVLARHWVDGVLARAQGKAPPAENEFLTEPGSNYIDFLLPGLMGMNLMGGGLFGIGFLLVDMRVRKLLKRLLATPMRRTDFLLALFVSRLVFLIPEQLALLLLGKFVFGVPLVGNPLLVILIILMGAASFDALGLMLASRTEKTETISGLINLVMLPSYLFAGTFFPSKRFGEALQPLIQALPLTQINSSLREVMLEGSGLADIAWRLGILAAWAVVGFTVGLKLFRWR